MLRKKSMHSQVQSHLSLEYLLSLILANHCGQTPLLKARIPSQISQQMWVRLKILMFQTGLKVLLMPSVRKQKTKIQGTNKMTKRRVARQETTRIRQLFSKSRKVSSIKPRLNLSRFWKASVSRTLNHARSKLGTFLSKLVIRWLTLFSELARVNNSSEES